MRLRTELGELRLQFAPLTLYQKFEQICVMLLSAVIAVVAAFALAHLVYAVAVSIVANQFDPTDYDVFKMIFGMVFTVIITLEFKRSLLGLAERKGGVVQVRTVILIGILAVVRKLIIIDLSSADTYQLLALAATILALGVVYWLVGEHDERSDRRRTKPSAQPGRANP